MAPESLFRHIESLLHHTSFRSTILQSFTFRSINQKYQKYLLYRLSISIRSHFANNREGTDNPFIALVGRFLIVCAGTRWFVRCLLLNWYLGSQKLRKILTLLCCITLSSSRENQRSAQEVARRISGAIAGESTQKSTYQVPITNSSPSHYIICHLPLIFLSPTSPLPFYSPSFFRSHSLF